jgi:hypothetical protein
VRLEAKVVRRVEIAVSTSPFVVYEAIVSKGMRLIAANVPYVTTASVLQYYML